jgi:hypothetical protein
MDSKTFNFSDLVWKPLEITKHITIDGESAMINRKGIVLWEDDSGITHSSFWKEYLEILKGEREIPEENEPDFELYTEENMLNYPEVQIGDQKFFLKTFESEDSLSAYQAILYVAFPKYRQKSKEEQEKLARKLFIVAENSDPILSHNLSIEDKQKIKKVITDLYKSLDIESNKILEFNKKINKEYQKVLTEIFIDFDRSFLAILSTIIDKQSFINIIDNSFSIRDVLKSIKNGMINTFEDIDNCIPKEKEKYIMEKIKKILMKIFEKIIDPTDLIPEGSIILSKLGKSAIIVHSGGGMMRSGDPNSESYVLYGNKTGKVAVVGKIINKNFEPILESSLNL